MTSPNNFPSNWDRKSRKAPWWWHWASESTEMQLESLTSIVQSMTWEGVTLTSGSTLTLTFTKQQSIRLGLIRVLRWCLNLVLRPLLAQLWAKNQIPTFGSLTGCPTGGGFFSPPTVFFSWYLPSQRSYQRETCSTFPTINFTPYVPKNKIVPSLGWLQVTSESRHVQVILMQNKGLQESLS